jgi:hypothetical protein
MAVTQRLHELRAAGDHQLADTLAVAALRNESPTVSTFDDHVRVETATFVGEHAVTGQFDPTDEASVRDAVVRNGRYTLADSDDRTFETGALFDAVVAAMLVDDPDPPSERTETAVASPGTGDGPDPTASDPTGTVGPSDSAGGPTAVLREAVAAVQNRLRN